MERSVIVKLNPVSERLQIEGNIDVRAGSVKFSCTGSMLRYTTMVSVRHGLGHLDLRLFQEELNKVELVTLLECMLVQGVSPCGI
jgi:hypothetical protein